MPKGDRKIDRNKASLFKKRHYVRVIKETVDYCTRYFGYKKKPYLFETVNPEGEVMYICRGIGGCYGIFYDYMQFRRRFADHDFETLEAYTMLLIAHEMRHYYQMRQLDSKNPVESKELLEKWRENDENPRLPSDDYSLLEFYLQPMEIDAELFAYYLVAKHLGVLVDLSFIDDSYIKELERYHIELFGEGDEELFPEGED